MTRDGASYTLSHRALMPVSAGRRCQPERPQRHLRKARMLVGWDWAGKNHIGYQIVGSIERQTVLSHLPASLSGNGRLTRFILEFQVLASNIPPTGPIASSVRP
jgi:hypothetical protein